ncbi:Mu transposase C-terminal domain-containing protein [Ferrovibrio sp.]|uniref:Mu transposase C-terminal domain-containing protein n=1 Tax=Ferrovibrio sp. TaxID=1917215 RepID=UPI003D0CFFE5
MPAVAITRGTQIILEGAAYTVRGAANADAPIILERDTDGFLVRMSHPEITQTVLSGRASIIYPIDDTPARKQLSSRLGLDLATLPEHQREELERRLGYLKGLREAGIVHYQPKAYAVAIPRIAQQIRDAQPPSPITVRRWQADHEVAGGDCRALVPMIARRGNRSRRICPEVQRIISDIVQRRYLTKDQESIASVYAAVVVEISKINQVREPGEKLRIPSRATLYRHIGQLSPHDVTLHRQGKRAAEIKYGARGRGITTSRILERVEIDHCLVDIFIIDPVTCLPLGRPWLTLAIDHYSRMLVGFYLSFEHPSWHSVMRCINSMIDPKIGLNELYPDMEGSWAAYGLPETLAVDNGKEFHSRSFEQSCSTLGIAIEYMPPRKPWFKGVIERVFRILNQRLLSGKPGYVIPLKEKSEEFDPEKHAVLHLDELREVFIHWNVTVYSKEYHRTLRACPADVWKKGLEYCTPRTPTRSTDLEVAMLRTAERVLQHYGVEINNLRYNCDELGALRQRYGNNLDVIVRYNTEDLGEILVTYEPAKVTIKAYALEQNYASGLPLSAHRILLDYRRRQYVEANNQMTLAQAKEKLAARIKEIQESQLRRSRHKKIVALQRKLEKENRKSKVSGGAQDEQSAENIQITGTNLTPTPLNTTPSPAIEPTDQPIEDWGSSNINDAPNDDWET